MTRCLPWLAAAAFIVQFQAVDAQAVAAPVACPVNHPILATHSVRAAGNWRHGVGNFGESLACCFLRLRGYEVVNLKLPGNQGIDLVAKKQTAAGTLTDLRLIEVKTHYGKNEPRLGQTRVGKQMSRKWLADRLRALHGCGDQGRKLALEISHFRKAESIPLEHLGQVHDVNLRTGSYTIRNPVTMAQRAGPMSIQRLLNRISNDPTQPTSKPWAMSHLSRFDQLRQARMGSWLSAGSTSRAMDQVSSTQLVLLEGKQALRGARRGLIRAAGRVAMVVAIAMDAYEVYGHVCDYRLGKVSQSEFIIALARTGGGVAGAWGAATGGAWVGMQIGTFGGPWAWVTVPVGGVIGGAVGGVVGYFGGSYVGEFTAQAWYGTLDKNMRDEVSKWLKETPNPIGN